MRLRTLKINFFLSMIIIFFYKTINNLNKYKMVEN